MSLLAQKLMVKGVTLPNRVVMPPLATEKSSPDGYVTPELIEHYHLYAGKEIGLIIVEHAFIDYSGKASAKQLGVAEDEMIEGLAKLAAAIRGQGCPAVMQINHAGAAAFSDVTGQEVLGPSDQPLPRDGASVPRELTVNDIARIVERFRDAAVRVKKAGFDGVEIHAAHGYLLNQFFSPLTNYRTDNYGGSRERRMALALDVAEAVRDAIGSDMLLLFRLGADDRLPSGVRLQDAMALAPRLQSIGIDLFDISGGISHPKDLQGLQGYFAPLSSAIKEVVSEPVLVTGGITDAKAGEEILREKKADLIGVGRALLKNSEWVREALKELN